MFCLEEASVPALRVFCDVHFNLSSVSGNISILFCVRKECVEFLQYDITVTSSGAF